MKNFSKILFVNIFFLFLIFSTLEIFARLLFPELNNEIHIPPSKDSETGLSRGVFTHRGYFNNSVIDRAPTPKANYENKNSLFTIIGDSISCGYGNSFQDIYWSRLERKYKLDKSNEEKLNFLALCASGDNLYDGLEKLRKFSRENKDIKHKYILYQFNYNDVNPHVREEIKKIALEREIYEGFEGIRMKYLHRSTFIKALTMNSKRFISKSNKECSARGLNAMGQYTWAFGHPGFKEESNREWEQFSKVLKSMHEFSISNNAEFIIFISPLLFDIDKNGYHRFFNKNNHDFSCSTISPLEKLIDISDTNKIRLINPTSYLKKRFEERIEENNFQPFYFPGDENHFNAIAGEHISDFLYFSIFSK